MTSWDHRRRSPYNRHGHRYGWFRHDTPDQYDAVVAMHPDEGTDDAILYAERHHIPAIICPCCVRPSAQPFWEPTKCHFWSAHLERMALTVSLHVRWDRLPMNGRNDVMILTLHQRAIGSTPTRPTKPNFVRAIRLNIRANG